MKPAFKALLVCLAPFALAGCSSFGGGATTASPAISGKMYPNRDIVENASNTRALSTLVDAMIKANLAATLSSRGPYTIFAPTDAAFDALPTGLLEAALQPGNRAMLRTLLSYHVLPGEVSSADIVRAIDAGGGTATFTTLQGDRLTARMQGGAVVLSGERGSMASVVQADIRQRNGVMHIADGVLLPLE